MQTKFTVRKRPGLVEHEIDKHSFMMRPAVRGEYLFDITIRGDGKYVDEVKELLKDKYNNDDTYVD